MIRGIVLVFRFLLVLFAVRLLVRALARAFAPPPAARPGAAPLRPTEDLVRDRVCNTFLPRSRALAAVVAGREEHFCSAKCRDEALLAAPRAS